MLQTHKKLLLANTILHVIQMHKQKFRSAQHSLVLTYNTKPNREQIYRNMMKSVVLNDC